MKIIQYTEGKWYKDMVFLFSIVENDTVIRFNKPRGNFSHFDPGFNFNIVVNQ